MEINYELTEQDYIEFNLSHMKYSKAIKRTLFIQRYASVIVFLCMPFILIRFTEIPFWFWTIGFTITSVLWIVFYPRHTEKLTAKRINRMIKEGKNKDLLGNRSLIVDDSGILAISENGESNISWKGIEKYIQTDNYIFIYNSSVSAYIVPKRAFGSEEKCKEFLAILSKNIGVENGICS